MERYKIWFGMLLLLFSVVVEEEGGRRERLNKVEMVSRQGRFIS